MARFFRTTSSFVRSITNISTPLCISFGVANAVPTTDDAPEYVQDVFRKFDTEYHQTLTNTEERQKEQWNNIKHIQPEHANSKMDTVAQSISISEAFAEPAITTETTTIKAVQTEDKQPIISSTTTSQQYLSRFIDHTVLKPKSTESDIRQMCAEAIEHNFFSVCCNPCWVSLCNELLSESNVAICCVVGFPLGSNTTQIKVLEAIQAVEDGANV